MDKLLLQEFGCMLDLAERLHIPRAGPVTAPDLPLQVTFAGHILTLRTVVQAGPG